MSSLIPRLRAALRGPLMTGWLVLSVLLIAASAGVVAWVVLPQRTANQIFPTHYTIYFGIDRVGAWWQAFLPAYLGLAVLVGNLALIAAFAEREPLISRLTAAITLAVLVVLLASAVFIALLNLS